MKKGDLVKSKLPGDTEEGFIDWRIKRTKTRPVSGEIMCMCESVNNTNITHEFTENEIELY